jgi:hypothetical protein
MPTLGRGSQIEHYSIQDETGDRDTRPVQVVAVAHDFDASAFEVEEMIFTANDDLGDVRLIVIDADTNDVNLRTVHDTFYTPPVGGEEILCIVESGVTIGSSDAATPGFDVGTWPGGVTITIENRGTIRGAGGQGGSGGVIAAGGPSAGEQGGTAFLTTVAVDLDNAGGTIAGGGGGGGGAQNFVGFVGPGGGGGAGITGGPRGLGPLGLSGAGTQPTDGTADVGGSGGVDSSRTGGAGGAPGTAGSAALPDGAAGGAAGNAIDGDSLVTYIDPGTIIGPQIN